MTVTHYMQSYVLLANLNKTHMDMCDLACGKRMKGQNINIITKLITYSSPKLVSDVTIQQGHGHFSPFFFWISQWMIKYFWGGMRSSIQVSGCMRLLGAKCEGDEVHM